MTNKLQSQKRDDRISCLLASVKTFDSTEKFERVQVVKVWADQVVGGGVDPSMY